jgi:hypothetical protein
MDIFWIIIILTRLVLPMPHPADHAPSGWTEIDRQGDMVLFKSAPEPVWASQPVVIHGRRVSGQVIRTSYRFYKRGRKQETVYEYRLMEEM